MHLSRIWGQQETERLEGYSVSSEEGLMWQDQLCVPRDEKILQEIMIEAHNTSYVFHPTRSTLEMKKDVAEYVSRCLTCQQVKAPRQRPAGLLQWLNIPQ